MIKTTRPEVTEATCDACGRDILVRISKDSPVSNVCCGKLVWSFGYGSPLDPCRMPDLWKGPEFHLCEMCWMSALQAIGIWNGFWERQGVYPKSVETAILEHMREREG